MKASTGTALTSEQARRRIAAPTASMIPRVANSLSFLFLDMMRIIQDDTGLLAFPAEGTSVRRMRIPTAAVSCLLLGPGTSITAPALSTLARHGTTVVCTGAGAVRCYAAITPGGQSSRWLEAQAAAWADPSARLLVATRMYQARFDYPDVQAASIEQLRGMEGQRMKAFYKLLAAKHKLRAFKRSYDPADWEGQDPVNLALSAANVCLYGISHAAITALGMSPGLGFVHTGSSHSFVYDIADLYKAELTLPLAFSLHASEDPEGEARRAFRHKQRLFKLMPRIVNDIQNLFEPGRESPEPAEAHDLLDLDDVEITSLWDPEAGQVAGGVNYGGRTMG